MNRPITMQEILTAHGVVGPFLVTDLEASSFFFSLLLLSETQAWEREVAGWDPPWRSGFFLCLAVPNNAEIKWSVILLWSPSTEHFIYYYFFLYSFSGLLLPKKTRRELLCSKTIAYSSFYCAAVLCTPYIVRRNLTWHPWMDHQQAVSSAAPVVLSGPELCKHGPLRYPARSCRLGRCVIVQHTLQCTIFSHIHFVNNINSDICIYIWLQIHCQ